MVLDIGSNLKKQKIQIKYFDKIKITKMLFFFGGAGQKKNDFLELCSGLFKQNLPK